MTARVSPRVPIGLVGKNTWQRLYRLARRAAGICRDCAGPLDRAGVRCVECCVAHAAYEKARVA